MTAEKMLCDGCGKWKVTFLTPVCGRCTYKRAQETARIRREKDIAREAARDLRGTVGDPAAEARALAKFEAFTRSVRELAGVPRRAG